MKNIHVEFVDGNGRFIAAPHLRVNMAEYANLNTEQQDSAFTPQCCRLHGLMPTSLSFKSQLPNRNVPCSYLSWPLAFLPIIVFPISFISLVVLIFPHLFSLLKVTGSSSAWRLSLSVFFISERNAGFNYFFSKANNITRCSSILLCERLFFFT